MIAVLGLVFAGASQAGIAVIGSTLAIQLETVSAADAKFYFVLGQGLNAASAVGLAAMLLAVSVLVFRTRVFPVWLGWVGVVNAILFLVGSYAVATTSSAIGGFLFVGFIISALWVVVLSVIMFRAEDPVVANA